MKGPIANPVNGVQEKFNALCEQGGGAGGGPPRGKAIALLMEAGKKLNEFATDEVATHFAQLPNANPWHVCFAFGLTWGHMAKLDIGFTTAVCEVLSIWNDADLKVAKSFYVDRGPDPIEKSLIGANMLFSSVKLPDTLPNTLEELGKAQDRWFRKILSLTEPPPYIGPWNATAMFMIALFAQPELAATQKEARPLLPLGGPITGGLHALHQAGLIKTSPGGSDLDDEKGDKISRIPENNGLFTELCHQAEGWSLIDVHSGVYLLGTRDRQSRTWF